MNYSEFYNRFDKKLYDVHRFKNSLGERIYIVRTKIAPHTYMVTGDDYGWELIHLFNPEFNVYADDEVLKLGLGLVELVTTGMVNDIQAA